MIRAGDVEQIVQKIPTRFRTFGRVSASEQNPIALAMAGQSLMFAAGVDVRDVVEFVLASIEPARESEREATMKFREQLHRTAKTLRTLASHAGWTVGLYATLTTEADTIATLLSVADALSKVRE